MPLGSADVFLVTKNEKKLVFIFPLFEFSRPVRSLTTHLFDEKQKQTKKNCDIGRILYKCLVTFASKGLY